MKRLLGWFRRGSDQRSIRRDAAAGSPATYVGNNRILTRVQVGDHPLVFYVEADDKLITPRFVTSGTYDVASTNHLLRGVAPDHHCIDVGANFGYFTCLMARLARRGKVIGIEADQHVAALARDNILINDLHAVAQVWHAAANATGEDMRLFRRGKRSGNTSMISYDTAFTEFMLEPASEAFTAKGLRIDDLLDGLDGRVDFLKIDVEGAEPLVFEGAREAIARNPRLQIIMEWSPGQMQAAGFDVRTFLDAVEAAGLNVRTLENGPCAISFSEVENLPYQAGLLLSRNA